MADRNLAAEISKIRDEKYKSECVGNIRNFVKDIRILLGKSFSKPDAKDSVQGVIASSANNIVNALNLLTGELKRISIVAQTAKEDTQLADTVNPKSSIVEASTSKTATAEALQPEMLNALLDINKAINVHGKEIVTTEKAQLANSQAVENAKRTAALVGNNKLKETVKKEKEEVKPQKPEFPFNFKTFMGGLGKILTGILNPVAMIAGLISHFLPYIILGYVFFTTVWKNISEQAKALLIDWGLRIGKVVLLVFALFKGPALLIRTLTVAYHVARMFFLTAKWIKDMVLWAFNMKASMTEHGLKISTIILERTLALLQFAMVAGGVVLIIGAIILLFALFGDKIKDAVANIIEVFKMIAGYIYDAILSSIKLIIDIITTVVTGLIGGLVKAIVTGFRTLFGGIFGGSKKDDVNAKPDRVETANGVTLSAFDDAVKHIVEPLNLMTKSIATLAQAEMLRAMNPINMSFGAIAAVASFVSNVANQASTVNADRTENNVQLAQAKIDDTNEEHEKSLRQNMNKMIDLLAKIEKKIPKENGIFPGLIG